MKTYDEVFTLENLINAYHKCRLGKSGKNEVVRYEMNFGERIVTLHEKLMLRKPLKLKYYHFTIYEPKKREVYATSFESRILLHCLCDEYLCDVLGKRLIYDNGAYQKDKGTHFTLRRCKAHLVNFYKKHDEGYVLKCDIKKYFDHINHECLKEMLREVVLDREIMNLLSELIDSYGDECGLPLGNQTSQWFALFYLNRLDRIVKEEFQIKFYSRYMDDFILVHDDKAFLLSIYEYLDVYLRSIGLTFNNKTRVIALDDSFDYLGFNFSCNDNKKIIMKLAYKSKVRIQRRIKSLCFKYDNDFIDGESLNQSLMSYHDHYKHGDCGGFRNKMFNRKYNS